VLRGRLVADPLVPCARVRPRGIDRKPTSLTAALAVFAAPRDSGGGRCHGSRLDVAPAGQRHQWVSPAQRRSALIAGCQEPLAANRAANRVDVQHERNMKGQIHFSGVHRFRGRLYNFHPVSKRCCQR
jgi:hypothetical protein